MTLGRKPSKGTAGRLPLAERVAELRRENTRLRREVAKLTSEKAKLQDAAHARLSGRADFRGTVVAAQEKLGISERRACKALGQHRSTQRYRSKDTRG